MKTSNTSPHPEAAMVDALSKICELLEQVLEQNKLTNKLLMEIGK